jgi:hypothetical protein
MSEDEIGTRPSVEQLQAIECGVEGALECWKPKEEKDNG